jgi:hypothetical protein
MISRCLIVLAMLTSIVGVAVAQDSATPDADPLFATVDLVAGGENLDPFVISVLSTGTVDASTVADGCVGFIPAAPDVALNWTGESDLLRIFFHSIHDAVITVVSPDGDVYCNDDASGTMFDPLVDIVDPVEGRYAIHVGHAEPEQEYPGMLVITSADTYGPANFNLGSLVPREVIEPGFATRLPIEILQTEHEPLNPDNAVDIETGFEEVTFDFTESGQIALFNVQTNNFDCTGFVESIPSAVFNWTGESEAIEVFVEGDEDSTLMVYTPSGEYICNDDTMPGGDNLNPSVVFETPADGRYVIYIGSFEPGEATNGTLTITEDVTAEPEALTVEDIVGEGE